MKQNPWLYGGGGIYWWYNKNIISVMKNYDGFKRIIIMEDDCVFNKYIDDNEIKKLNRLNKKYNPCSINLAPHIDNDILINNTDIDIIQYPTVLSTQLLLLQVHLLKPVYFFLILPTMFYFRNFYLFSCLR